MVKRNTVFDKMFLVDINMISANTRKQNFNKNTNIQSINIPNIPKIIHSNNEKLIPQKCSSCDTKTKDVLSTQTRNVNLIDNVPSIQTRNENSTINAASSQRPIITDPTNAQTQLETLSATAAVPNYEQQADIDNVQLERVNRNLILNPNNQHGSINLPNQNVSIHSEFMDTDVDSNLERGVVPLQTPMAIENIHPPELAINSRSVRSRNRSRPYSLNVSRSTRRIPMQPTQQLALQQYPQQKSHELVLSQPQELPLPQMDVETQQLSIQSPNLDNLPLEYDQNDQNLSRMLANRNSMNEISYRGSEQSLALPNSSITAENNIRALPKPITNTHKPAITYVASSKRKTPPTISEGNNVTKVSNRETYYKNYLDESNPQQHKIQHLEKKSLTYAPSNIDQAPAVRASNRLASQEADYQNYIVATNANAGALNNIEKVLFVCQICNTPFKTLKKLLSHNKRHSEIDQEERGSKRKDSQQNNYKKKQFRQ